MKKKNTMIKNSTIEWVIDSLKGYRDNDDIENLPSFDSLIDELGMVKDLK